MKIGIILLSLILLASLTNATEVKSFTVSGLSTQTMTFNLEKGNIVTGSLSVTGGNDDINFAIKDPSGKEIITKRTIYKGGNFSFVAKRDGAYTLVFDNSFSLITSKSVQVTYDVKEPLGSCISSFIILFLFGGLVILGYINS